jgi:hypothetical protein
MLILYLPQQILFQTPNAVNLLSISQVGEAYLTAHQFIYHIAVAATLKYELPTAATNLLP